MHLALAFIGGLSPSEIMIVLIIGLLLFGSRLPEVGRSLGRTVMEFKRGLKGLQEEMTSAEREAERLLDEPDHPAPRYQPGQDHPAEVVTPPAASPVTPAALPAAPTEVELGHVPPPKTDGEILPPH